MLNCSALIVLILQPHPKQVYVLFPEMVGVDRFFNKRADAKNDFAENDLESVHYR